MATWFVIVFDVLFVVPLFWLPPLMGSGPGARDEAPADAGSKWERKGADEFPGVDEFRNRLHPAERRRERPRPRQAREEEDVTESRASWAQRKPGPEAAEAAGG